MNILWVYAHPEPRSLNGALRDAALKQLRVDGHTVEQSDLYAMQWNPVVTYEDYGHDPTKRFHVASASSAALAAGAQAPEIAAEQQKLLRADAVVLQFPLWWYSMPAIMKGWVDRVFVEGFGYGVRASDGSTRRYGDGVLAGKRAMVVVSMGGSEHTVSPRGISGSLDELLYPIQHGILFYTGMNVLPPVLVASADRMTDTDYAAAESDLMQRVKGLQTDEPIRYRSQNGGDYDRRFILRENIDADETGMRIHTER
ncbi:putative NAD(P)H dehydrogenase (Quinone) [Rhodococcus sp. AW25M09]|uniref:NAD(P)H-dependent oxidoreductase n=1 Tax=Rhodococcus sp. AW25M09 TaxID=1268303 RepID=UPI0002AC5CC9|nr:NAD(P)H-dependent oxidoreductase [Rhodococcus sp. AW25M09]CCQ13433.1 putative NAD(P)H dehydrogenase (Quinone) [Rhodococcus sp. AW25M09]